MSTQETSWLIHRQSFFIQLQRKIENRGHSQKVTRACNIFTCWVVLDDMLTHLYNWSYVCDRKFNTFIYLGILER